MPRYAIVENETVVNCIAADDNFVTQYYPGAIKIDDVMPNPSPGWWYKDGAFICPPQSESEPETIE